MTGNLVISNTTSSISNSTGALVVNGGLGVAGNVYVTSVYSSNVYGTIDGGEF
jgi:hypothetical protein